jgi:hypothetical protein
VKLFSYTFIWLKRSGNSLCVLVFNYWWECDQTWSIVYSVTLIIGWLMMPSWVIFTWSNLRFPLKMTCVDVLVRLVGPILSLKLSREIFMCLRLSSSKLSIGFTANQQSSEFDFRSRSKSGDKVLTLAHLGSLCNHQKLMILVKYCNVHTPEMTNPRSLAILWTRGPAKFQRIYNTIHLLENEKSDETASYLWNAKVQITL